MKRWCAAPRRRCWPLSVNERAASLRLSSPVPEQQTILIAPAWPYANGPRHIGHVVGFAVPGDVLARYWRLRGARAVLGRGPGADGAPATHEAGQKSIPPPAGADPNNTLVVEHLVPLGLTRDTIPPAP